MSRDRVSASYLNMEPQDYQFYYYGNKRITWLEAIELLNHVHQGFMDNERVFFKTPVYYDSKSDDIVTVFTILAVHHHIEPYEYETWESDYTLLSGFYPGQHKGGGAYKTYSGETEYPYGTILSVEDIMKGSISELGDYQQIIYPKKEVVLMHSKQPPLKRKSPFPGRPDKTFVDYL